MSRDRRGAVLAGAAVAGASASAVIAHQAGTSPLLGTWAFVCASAFAWVWGQL